MTDHLSNARQWIGKTAQRAALTILPLSAAAVSQAAVILPSNGFFDYSGFGGTDPDGTVTALPMFNGIQGVEMELTSPFTLNSGYMDFQVWVFQAPASGSLDVGSTIPVSWSFDLSSVGAAITEARFRLTLYNGSYDEIASTDWVTYNSGGQLGGSMDLETLLPIVDGQNVSALVYLLGDAPGASSFTANSFNASINPVPEPSSAILVCGGLGVFGLVSRRRKSS